MKAIKKNVDELAKLLGLPEITDVDEFSANYVWESGHEAMKQAKKDGASDKAAEKAQNAAEIAAGDEVYGNWHGAVMAAVDDLFEKHLLMVVPRKSKSSLPHEFEVHPVRGKTWDDAAREIVKTIDGVGMAAVAPDDLKPPMQFVAGHLHWIKMYPEVYGSASAERIYQSNWR